MLYRLDELDIRILRELLRNSRRSFHQLAEELEVSTGTVLKRIKGMEKGRVIKAYSALLDHRKLGYELTAVTEITASNGRLKEMEKEISKIASVCAVYDTTGSTDAIIISKFKSIDDLGNFTKTLLGMPFVNRANTHVVLNTVKEDFRLL
ncbi:MAG: Lrp/AsnC family transcriptional regulator [Nitrososphaerales archaeon]